MKGIFKIIALVAMVFTGIIGAVNAYEYTVDNIVLEGIDTVSQGSSFRLTARVTGNSPSITVTLNLPSGLELANGQSATQYLGQAREFTYDVIARNSGGFSIAAYARDGNMERSTSKRVTVNFNTLNVNAYLSKQAVTPSETFSVLGTVRNYGGYPVNGANIDVDVNGRKFTGTTNSNGEYSISASVESAGSHVIQVTAVKDYLRQQTSQRISVTGSGSTTTNPQSVYYSSGPTPSSIIYTQPTQSTTSSSSTTTYPKKFTVVVYDQNRNPMNAEICVNGICVTDKSQNTFDMYEKFATVEIKKAGMETYRAVLEPYNGMTHIIFMGSGYGNGFVDLYIKSEKTNQYVGAKVSISNGQNYTLGQNIQLALAPGTYTFTVEADGYEKLTKTVTVTPGATSLGAFLLKENPQKTSGALDTAKKVGYWAAWTAAIVSILAIAISAWLYFRNPLKLTERF